MTYYDLLYLCKLYFLLNTVVGELSNIDSSFDKETHQILVENVSNRTEIGVNISSALEFPPDVQNRNQKLPLLNVSKKYGTNLILPLHDQLIQSIRDLKDENSTENSSYNKSLFFANHNSLNKNSLKDISDLNGTIIFNNTHENQKDSVKDEKMNENNYDALGMQPTGQYLVNFSEPTLSTVETFKYFTQTTDSSEGVTLNKNELDDLGIRPEKKVVNVSKSTPDKSMNKNELDDLGIRPEKKVVNVSKSTPDKPRVENCDSKSQNCNFSSKATPFENSPNLSHAGSNTDNLPLTKNLIKMENYNIESIKHTIKSSDMSNLTTLIIHAFGKQYDYLLHKLNSSSFPIPIQVWSDNITLSPNPIENLSLYEGAIKNKNDSYAIGRVIDGTFNGIALLPDGKTLFMEKFESSDSNSTKKVLSYTESNIFSSVCTETSNSSSACQRKSFRQSYFCKNGKEKKVIRCYIGGDKSKLSSHTQFDTPIPRKNRTLNQNFVHEPTCLIELISDPSHFEVLHETNKSSALAEIITTALFASKIFKENHLQEGRREGLVKLAIGSIVLQTNKTTRELPQTIEDYAVYLQKRKAPYCLSIVFTNFKLKNEPVTYAFEGGLCKNNVSDGEPVKNLAILNIGDSNRRKSTLFEVSWLFTKTIGQIMGNARATCEEDQNYTTSDWKAFFTNCEMQNMADFIQSEGSCLLNPIELHEKNIGKCGNNRVEEDEECDCGSIEECKNKSSCCVPPGEKNECRYDREKGYECDWPEICCSINCKLIPASWKLFCAYGEPSCSPRRLSYCDGKSSKCPVPFRAANFLDGKKCWPGLSSSNGAGTCKNGYCNSTVCQDARLLDCQCPSKLGHECRICCQKDNSNGTCLPAENFGLRSKGNKLYLRDAGTPCQKFELSGKCTKIGACSSIRFMSSSAKSIHFIYQNYLYLLIIFAQVVCLRMF